MRDSVGNKLGGLGKERLGGRIEARLPGWWVKLVYHPNQYQIHRSTDGALGLIISPVEHGWIARSIKGYGDVKIGPTTLDEVITFARLYLSTV